MSGHLRDKLQGVRSDPAPALIRGRGKGREGWGEGGTSNKFSVSTVNAV